MVSGGIVGLDVGDNGRVTREREICWEDEELLTESSSGERMASADLLRDLADCSRVRPFEARDKRDCRSSQERELASPENLAGLGRSSAAPLLALERAEEFVEFVGGVEIGF
jgi:hypothetical protein